MNISWKIPVELQFPKSGRVSVRGPQEALDYLLAIWPTEEGELYMKCKVACMEALGGVTLVEEARTIFQSAAAEVGIGWAPSQV
jgi:hypothetical protein